MASEATRVRCCLPIRMRRTPVTSEHSLWELLSVCKLCMHVPVCTNAAEQLAELRVWLDRGATTRLHVNHSSCGFQAAAKDVVGWWLPVRALSLHGCHSAVELLSRPTSSASQLCAINSEGS